MAEQQIISTIPEQQVEYRDVPEFLGYRVGDDGSVWGCRVTLGNQYTGSRGEGFGEWRRLRSQKAGRGYLFVQLRRDGRYHMRYVHRLVLEAFIGPCPKGLECRHFPDDDKTNNNLSNLSWATKSVNAADKIVHGTTNRGTRNGSAKLTDEKVRAIRLKYAEGVSQRHLSEQFGVSLTTISTVVLKKKWKHV